MRVKSEIREWFSETPSIPRAGRIHFVGIGGSSMSALARIFLHEGRDISGSDREPSGTLEELRRRGATIHIGHDSKHVEGASAVIVTDAIELGENPETLAARKLGLPLLRRSQALGAVLAGKRTVAVAGTHGKSTTTALLAEALAAGGIDATAINGPSVRGWDENIRLGSSDVAVVEACEAFDGHHDLKPEIVVLTNLEPDHMEFHGSYESLVESMVRFVEKADHLIYCSSDPGASEVANRVGGGTPYSFGIPPLNGEYARGALRTTAGEFQLTVAGKHMALNALGAAITAHYMGVDWQTALSAIARSPGARQRLEEVAEVRGVLIVNDYAHHPTEIRASFDALRERHPGRRLVAVHQPLTYTRTRDLRNEFVGALALADVVVLTDICPARESPIPGVSAALYVEDLEAIGVDVHYVPSRHLLPREVAKLVLSGDLVTGFGAGNISSFAPEFAEELQRESRPLSVAVFCGGESVEREVSILSGRMVADGLRSRGVEVSVFDPNEVLHYWSDTRALVGPHRPDIVFPAMHGINDEDGALVGLLELLHLPYVGSGLLASALAMDKQATKQILAAAGLKVPRGEIVSSPGQAIGIAPPLVVKPNRQGSTIGLTFVDSGEELPPAIRRALKYDRSVLVEELIDGVEISVPVIGEEALPPVEIAPRSGRYDFAAKYTAGATEEIVPARLDPHLIEKARDVALASHRALGLCDFSRTDMIVQGGEIVVLEVNSIPGLTPTSLVPRSAESVGISFPELCMRILELALERHGITKTKA
jgi:UDP-N-acetylmuramate--L-alanine ligase